MCISWYTGLLSYSKKQIIFKSLPLGEIGGAMKQFIRDYLTFNRRERNGILVLLSIVVLLLVYLNISDNFQEQATTDFSKFEKEIEQFESSLQYSNDSLSEEDNKPTNNNIDAKAQHFHFDPNNLSESDWKRLGLTSKQVRTIKNYESKGGKFYKKEDLKKIYGISQKLYVSLEPYIVITEKRNSELVKSVNTETKKSFKKEDIVVELNSADSLQLIQLKGIGAFYAKQIIKYRNLLGGFVSKQQLLEVWKLDQEKFDLIKEYVTVDASKIKKININTCTAKELKHPYLNWNQVNAIINYRNKHGRYKTVEEIKNTDLVDEETLKKMIPYLIL